MVLVGRVVDADIEEETSRQNIVLLTQPAGVQPSKDDEMAPSIEIDDTWSPCRRQKEVILDFES